MNSIEGISPRRVVTRPCIGLWAPVVLLLMTVPTLAQDTARMREVVETYVSGERFMGAVLVAKDGEVVFNKAYGAANLEWDIPNTATTKFRIGSITKQFTAAAILLLEERGLLSIDDPVRRHLPDAPDAWNGMTIFHVLTHTAGIPELTDFPDFATRRRMPSPVEATVAYFMSRPLDFPPGERFKYSNSGYILLGYLIERLTGQSYEAFVHEHIFTPLEMADSGYDSSTALIPRRAAGYARGPQGFLNAEFVHMSIPHGGGALYSTTADLLRWNEGLFGGELLSERSLQKMTTPFLGGYALGISVEVANGRRRILHTGRIHGFSAALHYYPGRGVTVVVLANVQDGATQPIAFHLAALAHGDRVQLPSEIDGIELPESILSEYVGAYQRDPGANFVIALEDGQLMFQPPDPDAPRISLVPESETRFFGREPGPEVRVEFLRDERGRVTQIVVTRPGGQRRGVRLTDAVR